jgi:hypothetical protein
MITTSWADYGTHDEAYYPELWHRLEFASCPALGGSPRNLARQGIYTPTAESSESVINGVMARSTQTSTLVTQRLINIFSVIAWVYVTTNANYYSFVDLNNTAWGAFIFHTTNEGALYAGVQTSYRVVTEAGYSETGKWLMYGFIADGTDQILFKNNYLDARFSTLGYAAPSHNTLGVYVGRGAPANGFNFANVMVWDRVISREEIALLAQSPTIAYTPRRRRVRRTYSIPATFNPAWARHSNIYIPAGARLA